MLNPPVIRTQDAYNCGLYSLWMALESLSGVDNGLGQRIEHAAMQVSDSVGGIFHGLTMCRIVELLSYQARSVRFHDVASFLAGLQNHNRDAILMAYAFDTRLGGTAVPDEAARSAHWSVLADFDFNHTYVRVANPHGIYNWLSIVDLVQSNLQLRNGSFAWRTFVKDQGDKALFHQQAQKYKNTPRELSMRGFQPIHLGGFFIAIQR